MKFSHVLPFVAVGSALVLPPEQVLRELEVEDHHRGDWIAQVEQEKDSLLESAKDFFDKYYDEVKETSEHVWSQVSSYSRNAFDTAYEQAAETSDMMNDKIHDTAEDVESWVNSSIDELEEAFDDHHHGPHHPPHDKKPNMTVYQLIASSKYTTKLAKFVSEFDDLVEALNSTKANYTVFAPTDKAFDKIPEHAPKPSREQLKAFLSYHVVPGFYPAGRVLASHTIPTLLELDSLGGEAQRLTPRVTLKGPAINWYSRIVAVNIFGTNGVIHGVDTPIFPPPNGIKIIDLFPAPYSTLELGLGKTGLLDLLNTTKHNGGTLFAPTNRAFEKLGPKVNAFLFSPYGTKYLKALLEYHVVPEQTLYSDAYYKGSSDELEPTKGKNGYFHVDLPTLLEDRSLAVDIARYGPFIEIKVNAYTRVSIQDIVAEDGVLHAMSDVIIPPKKLPGSDEAEFWQGEDMSVDELKERLAPFVAKSDL